MCIELDSCRALAEAEPCSVTVLSLIIVAVSRSEENTLVLLVDNLSLIFLLESCVFFILCGHSHKLKLPESFCLLVT